MVGIVIVSHSETLAKGIVELAKMMAKDAPIYAAGGTDDGRLGTSFEKISAAAEQADQGDGCVLLMDMGSAVMTAEMVVEALDDKEIRLIDAPLVEGAVLAAVECQSGAAIDEVMAKMEEARTLRKIGKIEG